MKWNNITGKVIPKSKRQKVLKDLQLLNMGYNIRHEQRLGMVHKKGMFYTNKT